MKKGKKSKECDIVMKGGVTSGIIYPSIALKLKDTYRFRRIGGTSAGAIAAAITAAAEYGRDDEDEANDGFSKLRGIRTRLSTGNFLRNLFQPSKATQPLMRTVFDCKREWEAISKEWGNKEKGFSRYLNILYNLPKLFNPVAYAKGANIGLAIALVIMLITALPVLLLLPVGVSDWQQNLALALLFLWILVLGFLGLRLGGILGSVIELYNVVTIEVPKNLFGMCTGRREHGEEDMTVLTDWLAYEIDNLAGITEFQERHKHGYVPLTFRDLRMKKFGDERDAEPPKTREDNITLQMITSNLNQHQPYVLPFKDNPFIFNEEQFSKLFPPKIVNHLKRIVTANVEVYKDKTGKFKLPEGYHFLPEADDLPVIVATRMSMSFPVLLSAVPLYTTKLNKMTSADSKAAPAEITEGDLQIHWFSDGGICSNFPIHFFDAWLPSIPTFGVKLTSAPEKDEEGKEGSIAAEEQVQYADLSAVSSEVDALPDIGEVYLPRADDPLVTEYHRLIALHSAKPDMFRFFMAVFTTAQNDRDNTQSILPSYRERTVQVRLRSDEGGLNLDMSEDTINDLILRGEKAADKLLHDFEFKHHQWVRFRILMKQLEANLTRMNRVINDRTIYTDLLENRLEPCDYPYPSCDNEALEKIAVRLQDLAKQVGSWETVFDLKDPPTPEPVLRVSPEV